MQTTAHNAAHAHRLVVGLVLGLLTPWQSATADADSERQDLARITHELEALDPLIREAESQSVPDARIHFRYDWLRQDLARMRLGIQEHIAAPRAQPRSFPPLRGDYRR